MNNPVAYRHRGVVCAIAIAASLIAAPAGAHSGTGLAGGFASGFMHPLSGGDHLLAMICVGLWGAFLGRPLIYVLPVIFPLMMVVGAIAGMVTAAQPPVEIAIGLSVLSLGLCIGCAWRAPVPAAIAIVAGFALFHGFAHGRELPSAADPVGYSLGFVFATGALHVFGIGVGELASRSGRTNLLRMVGAAIAIAGAVFLYRAACA